MPAQPAPTEAGNGDFKAMMTWRGIGAERLEQVRVTVTGRRIKAYGRIIAAATPEHEAFSASYDLITTDAGLTKRLSLHLVRAGGDTQISITRDGQDVWLVQSARGMHRSDFGGAQDVDLALSPFLNALPIRRLGLDNPATKPVVVPAAYLYLPTGEFAAESLQYTPGESGIGIVGPVAQTTITVDQNGFVRDYPGLAERI
ncbi:putative glycolipid-binding domain-containing protein [Williamsia sp.]|uniref:putative glycolipid-binding domain-containing protein n=1 Tax=Williamsia sp. TaxID=1872085 RepID=UPI002F93408B